MSSGLEIRVYFLIEENTEEWAAMLCTGEFVDDASSSGNGSCYELKSVSRGGITCEKCLEIVRVIKQIRL